MTKLSELGPKVSGRPHEGEPANEAEHYVSCLFCRQPVDMRDLRQVIYHETPGHEPLEIDEPDADDALSRAITANCPVCAGKGWVCEEHADKPWQHDGCGDAGEPCVCNGGGLRHDRDFPPDFGGIIKTVTRRSE